MKFSKSANVLIILSISFFLLYYGKGFLIPLVLAFFLWFIIRDFRKLLFSLKFLNDKIPGWLQNVIASSMLGLLAWFGVQIITDNINSLSANSALYDANLTKVAAKINASLNIDVASQIREFTGGIQMSDMLGTAFSTISSLTGNLSITLIYLFFIFLEENSFMQKIDKLYTDDSKRELVTRILYNIDTSVGKYLSIKTLTSFLTGFLCYIAMTIIGIDGAPFWGFLIFLMNYIPNIGSLIATAFPTLFAMVQFGDYNMALITLTVLTTIQLIIGNGVEPKLMGDSLNLSALVVLLALSLWGALWGITGMILSVPITVVMVIIFAEIPETRPLAIMLSEDGDV